MQFKEWVVQESKSVKIQKSKPIFIHLNGYKKMVSRKAHNSEINKLYRKKYFRFTLAIC